MKMVLQARLVALSLLLACFLNPITGSLAFCKSNGHRNSPKVAGHVIAASDPAVLTYRYDNLRTGATTNETTLTPGNVNVNQFGKRMTYLVDGQVYAQPLYVPNLTINGQQHNVVFVETEHDSVYAFDADADDSAAGRIWHTSFLVNGASTPTPGAVSCNDTTPEMGITGTPVIDLGTDTLYVVAFINENGRLVYRLHALDITNGRDKASLVIQASITGYGQGSVAGRIIFDARHERQRAALLLSRGNVYIAWGSFCDDNPYHGWLMSYSFDGTALRQVNVYNDTPDASEGGLWSPGAISADADGNIYYVSGNGSFNLNTGGRSSGDSMVMLSPDLRLLDYFTPFNQACLARIDADLGSSGPLVEPAHNVIIAAGKEGRIYVINRLHMGHYHTIAGACNHQNLRDVDKILQESPPGQIGGLFNTPGYWNGYVYLASVNRSTGAYKLTSSGTFSSFTPDSSTPEAFGFTGGNLVISSNGASDGILWTLDRGDANGPALRAYDATNLSHELYNSNQNPDRDALNGFVKFTCPVVANGEVFVPTSNSLEIYGHVSGSAPPPPASYNNAGISDDSFNGHNMANYDGNGYSYSSGALQDAGITPGASIISNGVTFIWPNLPAGTLDNYSARGQTILLAPANDATTLAFLGSSTGGNTSGVATINYTDGSTQDFTLGLTNWTSAAPAFGNKIVATMAYRNGPARKQFFKVYLFSGQVALQTGKTLRSVTLPTIPGKTSHLHIFAFATSGPLGSYNNIGTSDDSNTRQANLDGHDDSYSAQALQADGCNPGDNAFFRGTDGTVFQWPAGISGEPNNYIATGQTLPVNPLDNASILAFAGASVNGPSSGIATINYNDGSHQKFLLGFSDWTLNNGQSRPAFGNKAMYTMSYHNTSNGRAEVKTYVFFTSVALQPGKTVQSVTLPAPSGKEQMHIFAVATSSASSEQ